MTRETPIFGRVAIPGRPVCQFCGIPLDPHQAARGAVCGAEHCRMKQVQKASRDVFRRDWDEFVERQRHAVEISGPQIARAARMLDTDPGTLAFGVVPHQNRRIVALPEDRRSAFVDHLDQIIAGAFAEPVPEMDLSRREREEAQENPLVTATCTICQGKCCNLGNSNAFLSESDIQRFRHRHPQAGAAAVRAHYLGLLPERAVEYACLFHSETGCTIPRSDRADVCNRYHCNPQTQLLTRMRDMQADKAVIVGHEGQAGPVVAAFDMTDGTVRVVNDDAGLGEADIPPELNEWVSTLDAAIAQVPPPLPKRGADGAPEQQGCDFCGAPLDPHRAATTRCCGNADCEKQRMAAVQKTVAENKRARFENRRRAVIGAAEAELAGVSARLGVDRADLLIATVPYEGRPLEPLPEDRRAAFEAHLDLTLAAGFSGPESLAGLFPPDQRAAQEQTEDPLTVAGCSTCQGACCARGAETMAFLSAEDVVRYRLRSPAADSAEVRAAYLGHLPERSVAGSCVYLTDRGCALPRDLRAGICNGFHCTSLDKFQLAWRGSGAVRAVVIAHDENEDPLPRAVAVFDSKTGYRPFTGTLAPDRRADDSAETPSLHKPST